MLLVSGANRMIRTLIWAVESGFELGRDIVGYVFVKIRGNFRQCLVCVEELKGFMVEEGRGNFCAYILDSFRFEAIFCCVEFFISLYHDSVYSFPVSESLLSLFSSLWNLN